MTSLIDVIFLLLLFFMLSSTFSKFSEIELSSASGGAAITSDVAPLFLQLTPGSVHLNGKGVTFDTLAATLRAQDGTPTDTPAASPRPLLISMRDGVTSQRLSDLLAVLRAVPGVEPTVLAGGT